MRRALTTVVALVAVLAGAACTDDDRAEPTDSVGATTTVAKRPEGSILANRLGCTATDSAGVNVPNSTEPATDCYVGGTFLARLELVRTAAQPEALRRLAMRYDPDGVVPCPGATAPSVPWIVVGPHWIAITNTEADAGVVARELGGTLRPDSGSAGPIVSYPLPC